MLVQSPRRPTSRIVIRPSNLILAETDGGRAR
jgi:hypothetical protein